MISPRTQKKRLLALADQLEVGSDLTPEQRAYLVACFRAMGHGEDGNSAFGLSYTPGRSKSDEERRRIISVSLCIFLFVKILYNPDLSGFNHKHGTIIFKYPLGFRISKLFFINSTYICFPSSVFFILLFVGVFN